MALSYSHSEWFVPSYETLTDPNQPAVRRCVWHKARRVPKKDGGHLVRCSNSIGEPAYRRAAQLLEDLRKAANNGEQRLKILRELSSLILCQHPHRPSNIETVFNSWVAEIQTLQSDPATTKQAPKSVPLKLPNYRITSKELLERLGITVGTRTKCHGKTLRGVDCGNWISRSNQDRVVAILKGLALDWSLSDAALELLEELSGLIMCLRWHQGQAQLKIGEWTTILKSNDLLRSQINATSNPQTPPRQSTRFSGIETPETKASSLWTSPRRFRSPESVATTPNSSPSIHRSTPDSPILRQHTVDRSCTSPIPVSHRTRSSTQNSLYRSDSFVQTQAFEPLPTAKSPLQAARHVMYKIKEKLSPREIPSGFVYGFRRPGCDLIKIGVTTKTVGKRLRDIGKQCNYVPTVVFQIATKHAMKVEHLVHRQLYRQNRRECLVDARCNNGKGCSSKHIEWFEGVSDELVEAVVRAWARWMNLEPYDEQGCLKEVWVSQTKLVDLNAAGNIWLRWTSITLAKEVKIETNDEALDAAIKTEKALKVLSGLSTPKSGLSWRTVETRKDLSGLMSPVSPVPILA